MTVVSRCPSGSRQLGCSPNLQQGGLRRALTRPRIKLARVTADCGSPLTTSPHEKRPTNEAALFASRKLKRVVGLADVLIEPSIHRVELAAEPLPAAPPYGP